MSAALKLPDLDTDLVYVSRSRVRAPLPELSRVAVLVSTPTDADVTMPVGSIGTVVFVYNGGAAYEVEFAQPMGALATVEAQNLRLIP